jgi:hypothetical protein
MNRTFRTLLAFCCVLALVVPSAAFAAQSSQTGYGDDSNVVAQVQDENGGGGGPVATADDTGSLPFTGAELGVLAGAGLMLVLMGFGLRRMTHRPSEA